MLDGTCCLTLSHTYVPGITPARVFVYYKAVLCGRHSIFADRWNYFPRGEDETGVDRGVALSYYGCLNFFSNYKETLPMYGNFRWTGHFCGPIFLSAEKTANLLRKQPEMRSGYPNFAVTRTTNSQNKTLESKNDRREVSEFDVYDAVAHSKVLMLDSWNFKVKVNFS